MPLTIHKHFDYLTPFEEADNDQELAEIATLKSSKACSNLEVDALFFARMVEGVKHYEAWRVLGLASFAAFCEVRLNKTISEVETIVAGVKALSLQGVTKITAAQAMAAAPRARAAIGGRPPKGENTSEIRKLSRGGNDRTLARIKRDRPDIAERVEAGEFCSMLHDRADIDAAALSTPFLTVGYARGNCR